MTDQIRNVFISHRHEDDPGLKDLKGLASRHGITCRDYSITADNPNKAHNPDYIKREILAPRILQSGCLMVYVSEKTRHSEWVDWEIQYAKKLGKRIVGIWARGDRDCELPTALERHADAMVGWNGESIVDAISGHSDTWYNQDGSRKTYRNIPRHSCA